MKQEELRKYPRVKIHYPITYSCLDSDGSVIEEMMGVVLDISQSGIIIESVRLVASEEVLLISVDLEKNIINLKDTKSLKKTHCNHIAMVNCNR